MVRVGRDPVKAGLVASLARPGGNLTGLTMLGVQLHGKRLELLKEVVPQGARVAALFDARGAPDQRRLHMQEADPAARALGFTMQAWEVHGLEDFERVFAALTAERPDALYVPGSPLCSPTANGSRPLRCSTGSRRCMNGARRSWRTRGSPLLWDQQCGPQPPRGPLRGQDPQGG